MKSNIETLRETINKTVEERIVPLLKTIDNEEKLCKVLDLCSDAIHHTCSGMDVNKIIPIFEKLETELGIELELEKKIISKDVAKADVDIKEHEKMIKEILAKRTCRSRNPIEVIEESEDILDEEEVVDVDEVIIPEEVLAPEMEELLNNLVSKLNPNNNVFKNALASLVDLGVSDTSIIEIRSEYERLVDDGGLYRSLVEFGMFYGFDKYIQENKNNLKGVDLSTIQKIKDFMGTYASNVPGLETLIGEFVNMLFIFTGETLKDSGSGLYNVISSDKILTTDQVEQCKSNITNIVNSIILKNKEDKSAAIGEIIEAICDYVDSDLDNPQRGFTIDNSSIKSKFPKLEQIEKLYHNNKLEVEILENKDGLIDCVPHDMDNGMVTDGRIIIDFNGKIIDKTEKVFLWDKSQMDIEDCVCVKLSNIAAIKEFITKGLSKDLKALDEFDEDTRNFNKVVDMTSLPKNKSKDSVIEFIKDKCTEHLDKAINKDASLRFKVIDFKDNKNFKLVPCTKSKTNIKIEVKDGKVTSK